MSYFQEVVLPSVGLPYKTTYNMTEGCQILDCHYSTLVSYIKRGLIKATINKRIYASEFERFFEQSHLIDNKKTA